MPGQRRTPPGRREWEEVEARELWTREWRAGGWRREAGGRAAGQEEESTPTAPLYIAPPPRAFAARNGCALAEESSTSWNLWGKRLLALDLAGCGGMWRRMQRSNAGMRWVGADLPPVRTALPRAGLHGLASAGLVATWESGASGRSDWTAAYWGLWERWRSGVGAAAPPPLRSAPRGTGLQWLEAARFGPTGEGVASAGQVERWEEEWRGRSGRGMEQRPAVEDAPWLEQE